MKNQLLLSSLALPLALCACQEKEQKAPNILLINIDDLGWSDLSFNGSTYYETPNIDKLRAEGVYFPNAYAAASNSAPSRASLMTGVYAARHGVYTVNPADRGAAKDRKLIAAQNSKTPDTQFKLLPQTLKENGYTTCHVGKWHLGDNPLEQGIDVNIAGNIKGHPASYFSPYKNPNLSDGEAGEFLTDRLTSEAIDFLKNRDQQKPFFLYFATYAVHTPLQPKKELAQKYAQKQGDEAHSNNRYAALIESTDYNVGRLLTALSELGLDDNTLIIFTSDNGGVYEISKQWPLRAGKGSFYEGGVRIPFIVKWGDRYKENSTNESLISQLDIYPTLMSILGIDADSLGLDGEDMSNQFGDNHSPLLDRSLYWHFPAYLEGAKSSGVFFDSVFRSRPVSSMRQGDWKIIYNYESDSTELFNLKEDIAEKTNLTEEYPEKRDQMQKDLKSWLTKLNAPTQFELNPKWEGGDNL
ncbi:MAG: sulfatase [Rikenellaceae bacterium]